MTNPMNAVFAPSEDIVSRVIEGELILVPLAAGMGDMEDELYSLNETGREIWRRLDGQHSLADIAAALSAEFDAPPEQIEQDVRGLVNELVRRKMLVELSTGAHAG